MLLDLDNHNYCRCMVLVTYYYLSLTKVYNSVAVHHTLSVCTVLLKNSVAQNYTTILQQSQIKGKGKVHPRRGHEGPEGE
jgi:hypothetical protein